MGCAEDLEHLGGLLYRAAAEENLEVGRGLGKETDGLQADAATCAWGLVSSRRY